MAANLFVAVVPPAPALTRLARVVDDLRAEVPGLGWVDPVRWHVTLCFLGPVESSPELLGRLELLAHRMGPVGIRVSGAGRFGDRVLWARVDGDLGPLAAEVTRAASGAGYAVEDRPFRAHLTLARARRTRIDLRPLVVRLDAELAAGQGAGHRWRADEIVLMRGGSPDYQRLAAWPLAGAARPGAGDANRR